MYNWLDKLKSPFQKDVPEPAVPEPAEPKRVTPGSIGAIRELPVDKPKPKKPDKKKPGNIVSTLMPIKGLKTKVITMNDCEYWHNEQLYGRKITLDEIMNDTSDTKTISDYDRY